MGGRGQPEWVDMAVGEARGEVVAVCLPCLLLAGVEVGLAGVGVCLQPCR